MTPELCRDVAFESARRSPRVNPHELWAVLEELVEAQADVVVDLWSDPAVWWAWWSMGAHVIALAAAPTLPSAGFSGGRLPSAVVEIVADPREASTRQRVADQLGSGRAAALVLGGVWTEADTRSLFGSYEPLVRPEGLVLVHGIANEQYPGTGRFWSGLVYPNRTEMVGSDDPDGYGIVTVPRRETADHG